MTNLRNTLAGIKSRVVSALQSRRGNNVLLYLMFTAIAFAFWLMLSLDNEVQRNFDIPLEIVDVPDSVVVITVPPASLNVSVKAKGSQLVNLLWRSHTPSIKLKFEDTSQRPNEMFLSENRLEARLHEYFGNNAQILSCKPDSIKLTFTDRPGRRVKLDINADVRTGIHYVISGPITSNTDSVMVYSADPIPHTLTQVTTEPIVHSDLRDTTRYEVRLQPIANMRIIPDVVTVTVPVEPLISKKMQVNVEMLNQPSWVDVVLFPSKVEVSYLVPMSAFNEDFHLRATTNYSDIRHGVSKLPLSVGLYIPPKISGVSVSPDSVEYILQHRATTSR